MPDLDHITIAAQQGRDKLLAEAYPGEPSRGAFEAMARRRFQDPKPQRLGKWWYLLVWQDVFENGRSLRRRKRIKLAPATMPEREVRKIAAETLRPLNQGLLTVGSAVTFGGYFEQVYKGTQLQLMAKSTRDRSLNVVKNHLIPVFEDLALREMTPLTIQRYFSGMVKSELAYESKDKIRDVLSSIMGSAVGYGYLVKNPVEGIRLPPDNKGRRSKPYIPPRIFGVLVQLIAEPYATMVYVAVYTGLRISELIGLRWKNVHEDSIRIEERYCRGDWGAPKSHASNATIAINKAVWERLQRLKNLTVQVRAGTGVRSYAVVKSDGAEDLVFQSLVKGGPMRDNNILVRHIKPAARKLGLDFTVVQNRF
jgi:integrase